MSDKGKSGVGKPRQTGLFEGYRGMTLLDLLRESGRPRREDVPEDDGVPCAAAAEGATGAGRRWP